MDVFGTQDEFNSRVDMTTLLKVIRPMIRSGEWGKSQLPDEAGTVETTSVSQQRRDARRTQRLFRHHRSRTGVGAAELTTSGARRLLKPDVEGTVRAVVRFLLFSDIHRHIQIVTTRAAIQEANQSVQTLVMRGVPTNLYWITCAWLETFERHRGNFEPQAFRAYDAPFVDSIVRVICRLWPMFLRRRAGCNSERFMFTGNGHNRELRKRVVVTHTPSDVERARSLWFTYTGKRTESRSGLRDIYARFGSIRDSQSTGVSKVDSSAPGTCDTEAAALPSTRRRKRKRHPGAKNSNNRFEMAKKLEAGVQDASDLSRFDRAGELATKETSNYLDWTHQAYTRFISTIELFTAFMLYILASGQTNEFNEVIFAPQARLGQLLPKRADLPQFMQETSRFKVLRPTVMSMLRFLSAEDVGL